MGDGIVRKYAVIVNGDTEPRHQENVEHAAARLQEMGYETFVASTGQPKGLDGNHYAGSTKQQVARLIEGVRHRFDDDDEFVIYTTGHGDNKTGEPSLCLEDGCHGASTIGSLFDTLPGKQRTVIMDQCYSGNWKKWSLAKPRTLSIAAGSANESTCCQYFSPLFWSDAVPDTNGDGTISWLERYAYAMVDTQRAISFPQLHASPGYVQPGKAPFAPSVKHVATLDGMKGELARLKPGQFAIVTFSASWCEPCKEYAPYFNAMARQAKGQHLFLRTENEAIGEAYGHRGFPTVMIIDHEGRKYYVQDRRYPLEELSQLSLSLTDRLDALRKKMAGEDPVGRSFALYAYQKLAEQLSPEIADAEALAFVPLLMQSSSVGADEALLKAYEALVKKISPAAAELQLRTFRQVFDHAPLGETYPNAIRAYQLVAYRAEGNVRLHEVHALGSILATLADRTVATAEDLNTLEAFAHAYDKVKFDFFGAKTHSRENTQTLQHLRTLFVHPDPNVQKGAVQAYAIVAHGLVPYEKSDRTNVARTEIQAGAKALFPLIDHPDRAVRNHAVWALKSFSSGLSARDAAQLLPHLIDRVVSGGVDPTQASYLCYDLAKQVPPAIIAHEAPRIRQLFRHRSLAIANFAQGVYPSMIPHLTAAEADLGAAYYREQISNAKQRIALDVMRAYESLVQEHRLTVDEVAAAASTLRARFPLASGDRIEQESLYNIYEHLLRDRRLPRDEVVAAAQSLVEMFPVAHSMKGAGYYMQLFVVLAKRHPLPREVLDRAFAQLTMLSTSTKREHTDFVPHAKEALKTLRSLVK